MRAFLSVPGADSSRDQARCSVRSEYQARAAAAGRELSGILASAEPGPDAFGINRSRAYVCHGKATARRIAQGRGQAFQALAESLAAFIADGGR